MAKKYHTVCPILREAGVPEDNSGYSITLDDPSKNWIKELCWKKCPYQNGCIYDKEDGKIKARKKRWAEIRKLAREGKNPKEIQWITGLSQQTVSRALREGDDE